MNSVTKIARTAGVLYLLYVITSVIANLFGKFVFVEAPVTIDHILTHANSIPHWFCDQPVLRRFLSYSSLGFIRAAEAGTKRSRVAFPVV